MPHIVEIKEIRAFFRFQNKSRPQKRIGFKKLFYKTTAFYVAQVLPLPASLTGMQPLYEPGTASY
jgi:hypothetical protein